MAPASSSLGGAVLDEDVCVLARAFRRHNSQRLLATAPAILRVGLALGCPGRRAACAGDD
eukprot:CAMPEP_0179116174 /NCGR_PEP_ID=MMETSP0796-20121207/54475_1 /TAXON_ID=73915 /ORGANISM="Pyrodinium bahamense, Strain pbaha01" /LENGTH=59 /DNA_ID=CAMNT_0020814439 /DNA_START=81 /DNA_END=257 /DNA_ORIENTATION=+